MIQSDGQAVSQFCRQTLDLAHAKLPDEYYYHSLPLCVIDAVFSIGVRYTSTQNTVKNFCDYFDMIQFSRERFPPQDQVSIPSFVSLCNSFSLDDLTDRVYRNRQRTSTRSGILKSEAVSMFARVLKSHGVFYLQDVQAIVGDPRFEADIQQIPGQASGISTRYFYMLAGSDEYIKPDRMIQRFIFAATGKTMSVQDSHDVIVGAHRLLVNDYPDLTPRSLDYLIWSYQRKVRNG